MTKALLFVLNLQLFAEDTPPANGEKTPPAEKKPGELEKNYLGEIKTLKEENAKTSEELKKALSENQRLLKEYLNGETPPGGGGQEDQKPTIKELREDLYVKKSCKNNLEYFEKTLALRKEIMDKGEIDPFVPIGKDMIPEQRHFDTAQKIADEIQSCIDSCDGDPEEFNRLLDKKIIGGLPKPGQINR